MNWSRIWIWAFRAIAAAALLSACVLLVLWRLAVLDLQRAEQARQLAQTTADRQLAETQATLAQTEKARSEAEAARQAAEAERDAARQALTDWQHKAEAPPPAPAAPTSPPETAQLPGRHINQAQHDALVAALRGNGQAIIIAVPDTDREANLYGDEIAETLQDAGFQVGIAQYNYNLREKGLLLADVPSLQADVAAIAAALGQANILFRHAPPSWSNTQDATMHLELRVGAEP